MRAFLEKHAHPTLSHSAAVLPDFLDSVVGASSLGDGRSMLGFDERERAIEMRGIREKNTLEFWDILWVIIVCNKVY